MDDLLVEFLAELNEGLGDLDTKVLALERDPGNPEIVRDLFRTVHTIKGTCGFLGLARLERVAHAAENVLGALRDGSLAASEDTVNAVLFGLDRIKEIVVGIEAAGAEQPGDDAAVIGMLEAASRGGAVAEPIAPAAASASAVRNDGDALPDVPSGDARAAAQRGAAEIQSVRVSIGLLEEMMTMVGELVLARNQLMQMQRVGGDERFAAPLQRLSQITSELQERVMKTRMQPIGNAWSALPRLVRDLSRELGKSIDLRMAGAETELDRQVLDLIKDPLVHMVRNSADHGLETPAERRAAGKPETGLIRLSARHEGGHILIEIADDGRGIDVARVRAKALANGLASEAELEGMGDQQISQFIFRAGFSTAAKVTEVSGRGVGMDVVRANIERIGGTIELANRPGRGLLFTVKIPLTLAIASAVVVGCREQRFALPQISVVELVRLGGEQRLERLHGAPVMRLRDALLPVIDLAAVLGLEGAASQTVIVVVVQSGSQRFGVLVDSVFDAEEIVVKPVAPVLRDIAVFAGNTILGDGSVIMILDPNGLAAAAGSVGAAEQEERETGAAAEETMRMLVFRAGPGAPKAVPLDLVARLEDVASESVEWAEGKPVIQYRGGLMPLVTVDGAASGEAAAGGTYPVIVFNDGRWSVGLMADEIVDIVETPAGLALKNGGPGVLGTAVIAGKATDVVDVAHVLELGTSGFVSAGMLSQTR